MDNIYVKLQTMRVKLQDMNIKKTGKNKHMGYEYYELGDILPPINKLMLEHKVTAVVTFCNDNAVLELVNAEEPTERVSFVSPMAGVTLKGAHDIQNLGAVETYQRRYLYMTAFEVVESDYFDAAQGKPEEQKPRQQMKKEPPKKQSVKKKSKLSPDMAKSLNEAVADYSRITGKTSNEVLAMIWKETGLNAEMIDDKDGKKILGLIQDWTAEEYDELGEVY